MHPSIHRNLRLARILLAALPMAAILNVHAATDLVLPSEVAVSHWKTDYLNEFASTVNAKTNGDIDVKVFPASQLYNDKDALAALGTGAVHMVWPVTVRLETVDARTGIVNLPFGLTDEAMLNTCYSENVSKLVSSFVEPNGLQVLGFLRAADLVFVLRDKDVQSLEDLKGLKIRVIGGKVLLDTIRSFDASPVSMAASEMSTALSQGAIDGAFTSLGGWTKMIGTTGKHGWYVPGMSLAVYAVVVDKQWLADLPADQRAAVTDTVTEISRRQWKEGMAADQKMVDQIKEQGSTWRVAPPAEIERWRATAKASSTAFTDKYAAVEQEMIALEKQCGVSH